MSVRQPAQSGVEAALHIPDRLCKVLFGGNYRDGRRRWKIMVRTCTLLLHYMQGIMERTAMERIMQAMEIIP